MGVVLISCWMTLDFNFRWICEFTSKIEIKRSLLWRSQCLNFFLVAPLSDMCEHRMRREWERNHSWYLERNTVNSIMKGRKKISMEKRRRKALFIRKQQQFQQYPAPSNLWRWFLFLSFSPALSIGVNRVTISDSLQSSLTYCRKLPVRAGRLNSLRVFKI